MKEFDLGYYERVCRERRFPSEFWQALGSRSMFGLLVPRGQGGLGLSFADFVKEVERLSHSVATLGYLFLAQNLVSWLVAKAGSNEVRERLLPELIGGKSRVAMGLYEERAGSDALAISSLAARTHDGYQLSGRKDFVTDGARVDYIIFVTKSAQSAERGSLSAFIVPTSRKGLVFEETEKMGLDFLRVYSCTFEVNAEDGEVIGTDGKAWHALSQVFAMDRVALSSMLVGTGLRLLEAAAKRASSRTVFGRPIGSNQALQFPLAEAYTELHASQLLIDECSRMDTQTAEFATASAGVLYHSSKWAFTTADLTLQIFGAKGYQRGFVESCFRDVRYYRMGPLSQELSLSMVARRGLSLPSGASASK